MKKLILSLLVIASISVLTNKVYAQYAIPSFDVPVVADPTTFEEMSRSSNNFTTPTAKNNSLSKKPISRGERKLNVELKSNDDKTMSSASIEIYSLDVSTTYGPYSVYEGTPFQKFLNEEYEWGVRILFATSGCEMSVWFD
jgi:hypothetical protein